MSSIALIPAKNYSSRCANKNWKHFSSGNNLVENLLNILPRELFKKIIVSTDKLNIDFGNDVIVHNRNKNLSSISSPVNDLIEIIINEYEISEEDYIWLLNPTSPFRSINDFHSIAQMLQSEAIDSCISGSEINPFLWRNNKTLFDTKYPRKNTQDFNERFYVENGQFIVFKVDLFKKTKSWYSDKTKLFSQKEFLTMIDIDTDTDFLLASCLANHFPASTNETLKNETLQIQKIIGVPLVEHTHLLYNHFSRYDRAIRALQINASDIVIDASCGLGYGTSIISRYAQKAFGLDINKEYLKLSSELYSSSNVEFCSFDQFSNTNCKATKIISIETYEHLPINKVDDFIENLLSHLNQGGCMYLTVPLGNNEQSKYNEYHLNEPSIDVIYRKFEFRFEKISLEIQKFINSYGYTSNYCEIKLINFMEK